MAAVASVCVLLACGGCRSAEDRAGAMLTARLGQDARLTAEEKRRFFAAISRAIFDRRVLVVRGAISSELDAEQRAAVLGILMEPDAVSDAGPRRQGRQVWRGLDSAATPPMSEVDARQTLWIDTTTFEPRRYEFAFSMPGLGDYAYDLVLVR